MKKHISIVAFIFAGIGISNAASSAYTFNCEIEGAQYVEANGTIGSISFSDILGIEGATLSLSTTAPKWWEITALPEGVYGAWDNAAALTALSLGSGVGVENLKLIDANAVGGAGGNTVTVSFTGLNVSTDYVISAILIPISGNGVWDLTMGTLVSGWYGDMNGDTWTSLGQEPLSVSMNSMTGISARVKSDENGTITFTANQKSAFSFLSVSTVPEPSVFGLLTGIGVLTLATIRRRRK